VPVLAAARGYAVGEVVIRHRPRQFGRSKYGVTRIIKGFLDLLTVKFLTGFGQRPQHLLGTLGLGSFALGLIGLTYLAVRWLLSRLLMAVGITTVAAGETLEQTLFNLRDHPTLALYSVALLLLGGQLMSIGFVAELMIAYHDPHISPYSICERAGPSHADAKSPADGPSPRSGP
jgi:hypothetical protein